MVPSPGLSGYYPSRVQQLDGFLAYFLQEMKLGLSPYVWQAVCSFNQINRVLFKKLLSPINLFFVEKKPYLKKLINVLSNKLKFIQRNLVLKKHLQ
jgi:hypothetical protein